MKRLFFIATVLIASNSFSMHSARAVARISAAARVRTTLCAAPSRSFGLCPGPEESKLIDQISTLHDQKAVVHQLKSDMNLGVIGFGLGCGMMFMFLRYVSPDLVMGYGAGYGSFQCYAALKNHALQKAIEAKKAELEVIARETGIRHY